jgi:hypothetical protein
MGFALAEGIRISASAERTLEAKMRKQDRERNRSGVSQGERPEKAEEHPDREEREQVKGRESMGEPEKPHPPRQPGQLPLPD